MRKMQTSMFSCLVILVASAVSCQKAVTDNSTAVVNNVRHSSLKTDASGNPIIETGMTLSQINATIASASAGDTVWVEAGTYTITGKIVMKAGVAVCRQTSTNPIFNATGLSAILTLAYGTELNSCSFYGITFWNTRMVITSAVKVLVQQCEFDYGKRTANTNKTNNLKDDYVEFVSTDSCEASYNVFSHRSSDPGRGVWTKSTTNTVISNNTFGDGSTTGYFVCAINDNSQSNSLVQNNIINRNTALDAVDSLTDHGMYMHSFNGLVISGNTVTGWPTTSSGGTIKARNGQNLTISGNTLNGSGILLYEYVNTPAYPYLKYVVVSGNTINISSPASDMYHGIGYYRDNTTDSEYSINITGNLLPNGTIQANSSNINVTNFNAAGGGVYNNDVATGYLLLKSGITYSGNY